MATRRPLGKLVCEMREKRKQCNLSLRRLSEVIDISFSALARIERGDGEPSPESKARIEHWLGKIDDSELNALIILQRNPIHARLDAIEYRLNRIESMLKQLDFDCTE